MYILYVIGFVFGSALGLRVEAVMTVSAVKGLTEKACFEMRDNINAEGAKLSRPGGKAWCVKDSP